MANPASSAGVKRKSGTDKNPGQPKPSKGSTSSGSKVNG